MSHTQWENLGGRQLVTVKQFCVEFFCLLDPPSCAVGICVGRIATPCSQVRTLRISDVAQSRLNPRCTGSKPSVLSVPCIFGLWRKFSIWSVWGLILSFHMHFCQLRNVLENVYGWKLMILKWLFHRNLKMPHENGFLSSPGFPLF